MRIGKPFNTVTYKEYFHYIDNYKKYTDFNWLGLYRSIIENKKLNIEEKIIIRDYSNKIFYKRYEFLKIKDPSTYFELNSLGKELTNGDSEQNWRDIRKSQQEILIKKRIKHRNFGVYSKHICGNECCHFNGLMIKQGSFFSESSMSFITDRPKSNIFRSKVEKRIYKKHKGLHKNYNTESY